MNEEIDGKENESDSKGGYKREFGGPEVIAMAMEGERRQNVTVNVERVDVWKSVEEVRAWKWRREGCLRVLGRLL